MVDVIIECFDEEEIDLTSDEVAEIEKLIATQLDEDEIADLCDEYEKTMSFEKEMVKDLVDANFDCPDIVKCPCCLKYRLLTTGNAYFCLCGLRIPCRFDRIPMRFVKQNLVDSFFEHGVTCKDTPSFRLDEQFDETFLVMYCNLCKIFKIII